jgi:Ca2+-binding EF-hand superfamily protein
MTLKIPLLVTLLSVAGIALAQDSAAAQISDEQPPRGKHRGGFDVDRMEARGDRRFDAADADNDGMVTEQEFLATEPPRGRRGRGPGPGAEMGDEVNNEVFAALDADSSGQISAEEFLLIREVMHQVMKARMFERLDKNADGVLHRDELSPHRDRMASLDTDGNGKVSREEVKAAKQATAADE